MSQSAMTAWSTPRRQRHKEGEHMRIAVAGGTGVVGRHVVAALRAKGHESVVLSRGSGVDLASGIGLDAALGGVDAVIDVSSVATMKASESVEWFEAATSHLLAAGARAGVAHLAALSIVGVQRVELGYYMGKRRQEELLLAADAPVPTTVLRATQFHEFAGQLLSRMNGPIVLVPKMRSQPIAAREVGLALAELAAGPALGMAPELAGPQQEMIADMIRRYLRAIGSHRRVLQLRVPGNGGKAAASGGLLPTNPGPRGTQTFDQWLPGQDGPARS
jgi:uncharacterized protein YbjT (DUF2867 family)